MKKHRNVLFLILTLLLALWIPAAAEGAELLRNGDASQGLSGWTDPDGIWVTRTEYDGQVTAYDGNFFMPSAFKTAIGARTRIYQDVSVAEYAGMETVFSARVRTWDTRNTDETLLLVEYLDRYGNLLSTGEITSANDPEWHLISVVTSVPAEAVTARLSLYAVYWYGSECDSYFDDVSFVIRDQSAESDNEEADTVTVNRISVAEAPSGCWALVETVRDVDKNEKDGPRTWKYEYKDISGGGQYVIDYTWSYHDEYSHYTAIGECSNPPAAVLPDQRFTVDMKVYSANVVGEGAWGALGMGYIHYESKHYENTKGFLNVIEDDPESYNVSDGDRSWQLWAEFPEGVPGETISFTCQFHRGDRFPVKFTWTYAWNE